MLVVSPGLAFNLATLPCQRREVVCGLPGCPANAARFALPPEAPGAALYSRHKVVPLAALLAEGG